MMRASSPPWRLYDPATGTFSSTGSLATAREEHKDTLLPNGKVLIAGGYDQPLGGDSLASAELYNPVTGTFTPTGSMAVARYEHTSTLLPNGKVLITGGAIGGAGSEVALSSSELYDSDTGTFGTTDSMGTPRYTHTATLLANGRVLVTGGHDAGNAILSTAELFIP